MQDWNGPFSSNFDSSTGSMDVVEVPSGQSWEWEWVVKIQGESWSTAVF